MAHCVELVKESRKISGVRTGNHMNNQATPYGTSSPGDRGPRPPVQEDTLKSEKIQVERKTFVLVLKENARGRFLRITEDVGGRRDSIIVPSTGLEDFKRAVEEMVQAAKEMPAAAPAPQS
jgi:hypothetical protein